MNKDFQLILAAAAQEHVHMPATEAAFYVNADELANHELAQNDEQDFSAVLRRMEDLGDISPIQSAPMT
jgi:3-hydroxyisobutyrate dehydrogenase-like beta-hydroxyacid dehydrogenase